MRSSCPNTRARLQIGSVIPRTVITWRPSNVRVARVSYTIASSTLASGSAYVRPAISTKSTLMMASVMGSVMVTLVPMPTSLDTSTTPPSLPMFVFTTSMPTPRPERSVASPRAVVNPGRKTRASASAHRELQPPRLP